MYGFNRVMRWCIRNWQGKLWKFGWINIGLLMGSTNDRVDNLCFKSRIIPWGSEGFVNVSRFVDWPLFRSTGLARRFHNWNKQKWQRVRRIMIVKASNGNEMLYIDERNVENARWDVHINTYIIQSLTKPGRTNPGDKTLNNKFLLKIVSHHHTSHNHLLKWLVT